MKTRECVCVKVKVYPKEAEKEMQIGEDTPKKIEIPRRWIVK